MLIFKAKNIRKIEQASGKSFFGLLGELDKMRLDGIGLLLMAGGKSEDEADDLIDELGVEGAILEITKGLSESGFLPQAVREQMKASAAEIEKAMTPSPKTGEKTKSKPSQSA